MEYGFDIQMAAVLTDHLPQPSTRCPVGIYSTSVQCAFVRAPSYEITT